MRYNRTKSERCYCSLYMVYGVWLFGVLLLYFGRMEAALLFSLTLFF